METLQPNIEYVVELRRENDIITYLGVGGKKRRTVTADPSAVFTDLHRDAALVGWKRLKSAQRAAASWTPHYRNAKVVAFDLNAVPCVPIEIGSEELTKGAVHGS